AAAQRGGLGEARGPESGARARLDGTEPTLPDVPAERARAQEELRGHQSAIGLAEARLEATLAERDQLREALTRSEDECARLRSALETARSEDTRVEAALAEAKVEQQALSERLAEPEAAVARPT